MGGGPKPRIAGEVEAALLGLLAEANALGQKLRAPAAIAA
jgi:hypothetical protein